MSEHDRTPDGAFPGHAVLQIPVPGFETWVRARAEHYDPAYVSSDPDFVHAHVTALGPLPAVVDATFPASLEAVVGTVCREVTSAQVTFARIDTFPNGVVHLLPEPDATPRLLTATLRRAFPDVLPYGGEFAPVPHLTLDAVQGEVTEASTLTAVAHLLPHTEVLRHLDLTWYEPGRCRLLARWELGTGSRVR